MKNNIISVGIFFDGTGNNGLNAISPQKPYRNNESYYGATTNIFKLFELFSGNHKIYIEGIGTLTGSEDSDFAMATCKNPVGFIGYSSDDKLSKAFAKLQEIVQDETQEYQLFVYGFSRGSMLARTFCYELLQPDSKIKMNFKIKFLGVFDTVESTPFNHYKVNVLPEVEKAVHICAVNECRYFFPLTGFFENSKEMVDTLQNEGNSVHKEIFVPGVHADVGGGYLTASQSVYISANHQRDSSVINYIENIRQNTKDIYGNRIWNHPLENYKIEEGTFFSQGYVVRNLVYNDLSKVYGKLMAAETNAVEAVFSIDFNETNFEIDSSKHPYLIQLSEELEQYISIFSKELRPNYDEEKLSNYTHISANFGMYPSTLLRSYEGLMDAELINNGLNVPSNAQGDLVNSVGAKLHSEVHLMEDSIIDYAYGTNIPNNDSWSRTILKNENLYNKC
ncbi:DUF2235 domain-containing protein [Chryseobacterium sp. C39-AII1]|uniref:T6SS phospholipase effector Tle1-like catalytic domain-containing protein n=1 Tax=Chryseobacterium sp. C39-AII1 TaxID=3080332 RepID=UPI0032082557